MQFTKLRKHYRWDPVYFDTADILLLMEDDFVIEFVVSYYGETYWIGVASDFDRSTQEFFDTVFYINNQEFRSFEEFKSRAVIGGRLLFEVKEKLCVIDTFDGNPKRYLDSLGKIKKVKGIL
jgi:hypothetical protein